MRQFDYTQLRKGLWDGENFSFVVQIREYKGKLELFYRHKPVELERLFEVAKIQGTDSSHRIEGIGTSTARMKQ